MTIPAVLSPLVRATTWRRAVFLLLGGVLALPYGLLAAVFGQMFTDADVARPITVGVLLLAVVLAGVPVFLAGSRSLEIAAARALLGVNVPQPDPGQRIDREARLRASLWIALHLVTGALVLFGAISAFPMGLVYVARMFGLDTGATLEDPLGPDHPVAAGLIGLALLVALGYAVAGLGALAASMAPVLLGPAQAERIAALEARTLRLAERNRLARDLHDSVGHALTVAILQAGAGRELLDTDPEFARRALLAIEETSRRAVDDLDHVLGLLREVSDDRSPATAPQPTLQRLDRLVADARAAGLSVECAAGDPLGALPAVVSREGYRIVQEGLTNAARHGHGPVTLCVAVPGDVLTIELVNAVREAAGPGGGRGLHGMRERVLLLGGELTAGREGDRWRVRATLPVPRGESG